jgi:hypothetical protein
MQLSAAMVPLPVHRRTRARGRNTEGKMREREDLPARELDERMPAIFEPDTLLASQYFDRLRGRVADAERRLMIAVLEDAVNVYLKHDGGRGAPHEELFREAEEWIENRDASWLFSFENICHVLDLQPDYLRRGLHAGRQRAGRVQREAGPEPEERPLRRASNG